MITVVGSINMDLIVAVHRLPKPGETLSGSSFSTAAGGKGANQTLAARRAGAEIGLVGAVGDDAFATSGLCSARSWDAASCGTTVSLLESRKSAASRARSA